MIATNVIALRTVLRSALLADSVLAGRLGPSAIFDEAAAGASLPYIAFGEVRSRDWSTATSSGAEHVLVLEIWSKHRGQFEALEIAALAAAALDAAPLAVPGCTLVSLRQEAIQTARRDKGRLAVARMTYRAVVDFG